MSVSFLAAAAAAVVAAVVTGILVARFVRLLRLDQAAWAYAATGFTISLAAQALGYHQGFNAVAFRAVYIGAGLVAPMALIWGLAELTGKGFWARFAARLVLAALTVIAAVILAADPLSGVTFTTAWPSATVHYQLIAHAVLLVIAAATVLPALIALAVAAVRARRVPGWREAFPAVAAAALAALLTAGLQLKLPINSGYVAICLIGAVLTWFAGQRSGRLRLEALRGTAAPGDDTGWGQGYSDDTGYNLYRPDTGNFARVGTDTDFGGLYRADTGGFEEVGGDTGYGLYRPDTGAHGRVGTDTDFSGLHWADTGGFEEVGGDTGYGFYRTDPNLRPVVNGSADRVHQSEADRGHRSEPVPGIVETGDILPVSFDVFTPAARETHGPADEETARLYGRIAIYTLIDGQAEEFDRLAQVVVERVKALEPDTLAYIVHGVPSAPIQRILYEVYRDEAAFEDHSRQPYIMDFEEEGKPYILATNVIELGVREAKLSPLPGPSGQLAPSGPPRPPGPRAPSGPPGPPGPFAPSGQPGLSGQPRPSGQPRLSGQPPSGSPGPSRQPGPAPPGGQSARRRSNGTR